MRKNKFVIVLVAVFLLFDLIWIRNNVHAYEQTSAPRVLFISSYSYSWPTVPLQIEGIERALNGGALLDIQFMNTKEINMKEKGEEIYEKLKDEIQMVNPYDAVIAGDDDALHFVKKYRKDLFENIPVVFEAVEDLQIAEEMAEYPLITGIVEQTPYDDNIKLIKKLFPETRKLVAIVDDTATGIGTQKQFTEQKELYPEFEFEMINSSKLTNEELKEKIASCSEDSVLLYLIMTEDSNGTVYTSQQACNMICDNANVPVMRYAQAGIGEGVLGGKVVLLGDAAQIAGTIVMQILNGADPDTLEMIKESPESYCFDFQVMKKYGIKKSQIPPNSVIVNDDTPFYKKYAIGILLALLGVMVLLTIYIEIKKQKINKTKQLMENMALKDHLTGCYTRYYLQTQIIEEETGNWRDRDKKYSVAIIDIDHFKSINDRFGHSIGDDVLYDISQILIKSCKEENGDCVLRYFGDEFVILYSDVDIHELKKRLQFIIDKTEKIQIQHVGELISLNIGAELCTADRYRYQELLDGADRKLFRSREKGRNLYTI